MRRLPAPLLDAGLVGSRPGLHRRRRPLPSVPRSVFDTGGARSTMSWTASGPAVARGVSEEFRVPSDRWDVLRVTSRRLLTLPDRSLGPTKVPAMLRAPDFVS